MTTESSRPALAVPRDQALATVSDVLRRGEAAAAAATSVRDEPSLEEWVRDLGRWRKFTATALQSISIGDALEREFTGRRSLPRAAVVGAPPPTVAERLERRMKQHQADVNIVRSVIERLPLIPEPGNSGGGTRAEFGRGVFVVHGRQHDSAEIVARFVERLGLEAIILDEQANKGRTIIEKFEANAAAVGFAIVLFLADDWARGPDDDSWPAEPTRARQNVVLEAGYFVGKLGRERVTALMGKQVEQPSDIHGLAYIPFDGSWQMSLLKEMKVVYPDLDANKAFD